MFAVALPLMRMLPPASTVGLLAIAPLRNSSTLPPLNTMSLVTTAVAALTSWMPSTKSPDAVPRTVSLPPCAMVEPELVPPPEIVADAPDRIVAATAVPPDSTSSELPLVTMMPVEVVLLVTEVTVGVDVAWVGANATPRMLLSGAAVTRAVNVSPVPDVALMVSAMP